MRTFYWVSGELTEAQRFINVPMRWCEQYPARERRELWIKDREGPGRTRHCCGGDVMPR